ncbi:uncharacterized protein [Lepisosteus oculatus]|uniref:uncharacterized protein n=1 Tax=Lepisosteus oculatus TaxID=7918 RepID=UPI0035F518AE
MGLPVFCLLVSLSFWGHTLGEKGVTLFSTVGGSVIMSCQGSRDNQAYFFEWDFLYKSKRIKIINGKQQITVRDPERAQRMSVGSDWSLHIHSLNTQDIGQYLCEQNINGHYFLPGRTTVDLYLLSISASPSGGLKTDTVLTLQCGLDCGGGFQSCAGKPADVQVTWESDHLDTVDISQDRYFSSLSMKLQSSDHMRNRTCVLRERGVMKTSDTYTIHLTEDDFLVKVLVPVAAVLCVLLVLVAVVTMKRRRRKVTGRAAREEREDVAGDLPVCARPAEPTAVQGSPSAPGGDEVSYSTVNFAEAAAGPQRGQGVPREGETTVYSDLRTGK